WNFTPCLRLNVQSFPFLEPHFVASPGRMRVVPGFSETKLSKICSVARNDSPSETSAGSRYVGSDAPAITNVGPAFDAPPAVPTATSAANATSAKASLVLTVRINVLLPYGSREYGTARRHVQRGSVKLEFGVLLGPKLPSMGGTLRAAFG